MSDENVTDWAERRIGGAGKYIDQLKEARAEIAQLEARLQSSRRETLEETENAVARLCVYDPSAVMAIQKARAAIRALIDQPAAVVRERLKQHYNPVDLEKILEDFPDGVCAHGTPIEVDCPACARPAPAPSQDGWFPIESAPRDGSYVLGFGLHDTRKTYMDVVHFWRDNWTITWMEGYGAPTHWRPLPEAPRP